MKYIAFPGGNAHSAQEKQNIVEANSTISLTRLHYQYVTRDITCRSFHTYLIDKKP